VADSDDVVGDDVASFGKAVAYRLFSVDWFAAVSFALVPVAGCLESVTAARIAVATEKAPSAANFRVIVGCRLRGSPILLSADFVLEICIMALPVLMEFRSTDRERLVAQVDYNSANPAVKVVSCCDGEVVDVLPANNSVRRILRGLLLSITTFCRYARAARTRRDFAAIFT